MLSMYRVTYLKALLALMLGVSGMLAASSPSKAQDMTIYTDSLQNGWQNWSWAKTDLSNTSPVHAGSDSISVTAGAWAALSLHTQAFDTSKYASLSFWINGGKTTGQLLQVTVALNGKLQTPYQLSALTNGWQHITIPLSALGAAKATNMDGFIIQDRTGSTQPTFYVDDISLTSSSADQAH